MICRECGLELEDCECEFADYDDDELGMDPEEEFDA